MSETKGLKILTHGSLWFAPVLIPLLIFLLKKDEEVQKLSLQALFYQFLLVVIGFFGLIGLSIISMFAITTTPETSTSHWDSYLVLIAILGLILYYYVGVPTRGIFFAAKERPFNYPVVGRFIK